MLRSWIGWQPWFNLMGHWQLRSFTDLCASTRYVYVSLSLKNSLSVHVLYVSFSLYLLTLTYICYFMQASSEAGVLEPHQVDPPVPPPTVRVCISFFEEVMLSVHVVYVSFSLYKCWHWHMLLYAGIYWPTSPLPPCTCSSTSDFHVHTHSK